MAQWCYINGSLLVWPYSQTWQVWCCNGSLARCDMNFHRTRGVLNLGSSFAGLVGVLGNKCETVGKIRTTQNGSPLFGCPIQYIRIWYISVLLWWLWKMLFGIETISNKDERGGNLPIMCLPCLASALVLVMRCHEIVHEVHSDAVV